VKNGLKLNVSVVVFSGRAILQLTNPLVLLQTNTASCCTACQLL